MRKYWYNSACLRSVCHSLTVACDPVCRNWPSGVFVRSTSSKSRTRECQPSFKTTPTSSFRKSCCPLQPYQAPTLMAAALDQWVKICMSIIVVTSIDGTKKVLLEKLLRHRLLSRPALTSMTAVFDRLEHICTNDVINVWTNYFRSISFRKCNVDFFSIWS